MSTALYPLGMKSYNNHLPQGGYRSWKDQFPVGITPTHIRPLTNNDPANWYPGPFGKPRPLKQYRKGVGLSSGHSLSESTTNNLGRVVKTSQSQSLNGGLGLLGQLQGVPGNYQIRRPSSSSDVHLPSLDNCDNCDGFKIVDTYKPQPTYLTDNPEPLVTETKELCCNPEKNALKGVIYASQNCQDANYYPNSSQYLQNKCMTYDQKAFNFSRRISATEFLTNCQPYGGTDCSSVLVPDYATNTYVIGSPTSPYPSTGNNNASCTSCKVAVYKPNNKPFATQGSVSSSTRIAKLTANTLENSYQMIYRSKPVVLPQSPCGPCYTEPGTSTTSSCDCVAVSK